MLSPNEGPKVGFRLLSSAVTELTPALVKQYHDMAASPTEREINAKHVKHLREKADNGQFVTFHWVTAKVGDQLIRVNGQHSSKMLFDMDGMMPPGLKVLQEQYECEDGDSLALLFQQFDDRKSARSTADIAGVYQGLQPALNGVDKKIAKLAIDAYTWFQRNVEKVPAVIGDLSYSTFRDTGLHPWIVWLNEINNSKTRELQNRFVTAAIYGTFSHNETEARRFWEEVSRGGDPDDDTQPARALDIWLRSIFEKTTDDEPASSGQLYQGSVYCWNAYREDKSVSSVKFEVKKNFAPIRG